MPERIQDFLKPNKQSSVFHQGEFHPINEDKYIGDLKQIYYRSGWEFDFYKWMDQCPSVVRYSVESVQVPYISPIDKKAHRYFIDVYAEIILSGKVTKWFIEIKPHKYTVFPKMPKRKTKKSLENYKTDYNKTLVNIAKFKAAKYYADQMGAHFGVVGQNKTTKKFNLLEWSEKDIKTNDKRE